ncbi:uncharacterized protein V6R79_011652 [Siganus canaliculatus]
MSSSLPGEQRLTRQRSASDVKQKAADDKRRRDAACYLFIGIQMDRSELLLQQLHLHEVSRSFTGCCKRIPVHRRSQRGFGEFSSHALPLHQHFVVNKFWLCKHMSVEGNLSFLCSSELEDEMSGIFERWQNTFCWFSSLVGELNNRSASLF